MVREAVSSTVTVSECTEADCEKYMVYIKIYRSTTTHNVVAWVQPQNILVSLRSHSCVLITDAKASCDLIGYRALQKNSLLTNQ